ncbi:MAG: IS4 family transposase [Streptomycetaceae bacterium]|nr:IS4 family transposase [Streptomycetaceae bacterium]
MSRGHIAGETYPERIRMGLLSRTFTPELVDFVVDEAGAREERTRSLPSRLVVYFVLTMWLFTGNGYGLVLRELVEHWPRRRGEEWRPARTGSLTSARQRVGPGPLRLLFDRVAGPSGTPATPGAFWRGLRLASLDGSLFDVPDSEANAAAYTRASNGDRPGPYPQVRLLALVECGTKAMIGAVFDSFAVGERTLAWRLLAHLHTGMLLMADRGFPAFELWQAAAATGAQLLWRASGSFALPVDRVLSDGTYLSHLNGARGKRIAVRVIEYTVVTTTLGADGVSEETSELFRLISTLLDPATAPARELAELYTARWTSETIFKHIKIEQRGGRTATLRSNSPAMVEQELWAMLCVYQAIHQLAADTADRAHLPVSHISFKQTLAAARRSVGADFPPSPANRQGP